MKKSVQPFKLLVKQREKFENRDVTITVLKEIIEIPEAKSRGDSESPRD
jgi:hypothetical protein